MVSLTTVSTGTKFSKGRITIIFCCCAVGEKLPQIVIGKAKSTRCVKNRKLPLEYFGNKSSWMTTEIFSNWLKTFDMKMTQEKRKVFFLLDDAPIHPCQFTLTSAKLLFFSKKFNFCHSTTWPSHYSKFQMHLSV